MNKDSVVHFLRLLYKVLPFLIAAVSGGVATAAISGCKCGSIVSFVSPAV